MWSEGFGERRPRRSFGRRLARPVLRSLTNEGFHLTTAEDMSRKRKGERESGNMG